jgi:hypothetical protein
VSISRANSGFYLVWNLQLSRYCKSLDSLAQPYANALNVYVGKLGNAYFYRNEIAGQTDFFYGEFRKFLVSVVIKVDSLTQALALLGFNTPT